MNYEVYSIFDKKVGVYGLPFFVVNQIEAFRDFETLALDNKSKVGQWPTDFDLMYIGTFDSDTGLITIPKEGTTDLINANVIRVSHDAKHKADVANAGSASRNENEAR